MLVLKWRRDLSPNVANPGAAYGVDDLLAAEPSVRQGRKVGTVDDEPFGLAWTSTPEIFKLDPRHLTSGPNT